MIKINDQFSIEKDPHCWVLYETKKGKNKKIRKTGKKKDILREIGGLE